MKATPLYLDAETNSLTECAPIKAARTSYISTDRSVDACARFSCTIPEEMELVGPSNLKLWVETTAGEDMDLFATFYKKDAKGRVLYHVVFPYREKQIRLMIKMQPKNKQLPGGPIYVGPNGRLRVSHRALDGKESTELAQVLTHENPQPICPGEPVQVEIGLWPVGMKLHKGETLVLEIAGHVCGPVAEARASDENPDAVLPTVNCGTHIIHTGGKYKSVLLLPVVSTEQEATK